MHKLMQTFQTLIFQKVKEIKKYSFLCLIDSLILIKKLKNIKSFIINLFFLV